MLSNDITWNIYITATGEVQVSWEMEMESALQLAVAAVPGM